VDAVPTRMDCGVVVGYRFVSGWVDGVEGLAGETMGAVFVWGVGH
jgi:hypothetical protein